MGTTVGTNEWRPLDTFRGSVRVLLRVLRFLGDAAIAVVVVVIPIATLLALPVLYIRRRLGRSRGEVAHSSKTAPGLGGKAEEDRR